MAGTDEHVPWTEPAWLERATAWIDRELARAGLERDGAIEQAHVRWWSTALRVPTTDGLLWFKAPQPEDAFEARLTPLLASLRPEEIAEVVATDGERGWMLTRDAGKRVREIEDGPSLERWEELLPRYAELQLEVAPRRDELLALGVPDLRLSVLPRLVRSALDDPEAVLLGREGGLTAGEHASLLAALPELEELCRELSDGAVPETLQHDDFHDGNVFVRDGRYVFFDWGDACVSHPFHTLVVTLRSLAYMYRLSPGGRAMTRLRDAYLEPWTRLASREDIHDAAHVARRTGTVQRALAWYRGVEAMPPAIRAEYIDSVPYGLRLFLMDGPYGTWDDGTF